MFKYIKKILIVSLLIHSYITMLSSADTISLIANKNLSISGYFFSSGKSLYFLRNINENNSSLWQYTSERKFKPIHNTKSFDGYDKAGIVFADITVGNDYNISISNTINSDGLYEDIANKTFSPTHLLLKDKDNSNDSILTNKSISSLWQYTNNKFKPIHNAKAFDGYEEAKKLFDDITMTKDNIVHIGSVNKANYISLRTKENNATKTRAVRIVKQEDYEDNLISLSSNLIQDKANNLIWQNNNDDMLRTYDEAKLYCENLTIDGYSDFRLPNKLEIYSLFNTDITNKQIEFLNFKTSSRYWGHTKSEDIKKGIKNQFSLSFHPEIDKVFIRASKFKSNHKYYNKCVLGNSLITPVLIRDNKSEIVLDATNNIMWQDNLESRSLLNKSSALEYCHNLKLGNHNDWRLPSINEFLSLLDVSTKDSTPFMNFKSHYTYIPSKISEKSTKEIISFIDKVKGYPIFLLNDALSVPYMTDFSFGNNRTNFNLGSRMSYNFISKTKYNIKITDKIKYFVEQQDLHHKELKKHISIETRQDIYNSSDFIKEKQENLKNLKAGYEVTIKKLENAKKITNKQYDDFVTLSKQKYGELKSFNSLSRYMSGTLATDFPGSNDGLGFEWIIDKALKDKVISDGYTPVALLESENKEMIDAIKKTRTIVVEDDFLNISTLYELLDFFRETGSFFTSNTNIFYLYNVFGNSYFPTKNEADEKFNKMCVR